MKYLLCILVAGIMSGCTTVNVYTSESVSEPAIVIVPMKRDGVRDPYNPYDRRRN
jgi:uncharacterized protein YceK